MRLTRTLLVAGTGAAIAYFFDPVSGKERRQKVREFWEERMQGSSDLVAEVEVEDAGPTIVVNKQATSQ
jgi:hypothetical protein